MTTLLDTLLRSDGFMPHGHCYLWTADILVLHVASDLAIALAYYSIPAALITFVRRREDVAFSWIFLLFAMFIFACGTTHLASAWTTWFPHYRAEGVIKALTAVVSLGTAAILWPLLPRALTIPSRRDLESANEALASEVRQRRAAEREARELNRHLEERVRVRTGRLEQANRELESFSYSVTHDLRAPLRAIRGFAGILMKEHADGLGDGGRRLAEKIVGNVDRMGTLIDDILAFSRLGQWEPDREPLDMERIFAETFDEIAQEEPERHVELRLGALRRTTGDPTLVEQAVRNLLTNAFKYTRGRERARIEVSGREADGEYVYTVSDNGVGFDPRHADRVFDAFRRLHDAREFDGSGVGLAIVERVVRRHGGRVWAEGSPGRGASFHFTLPERGNPPASR